MAHLYTIFIKEIWQDPILKILYRILPEAISDKKLFQIKQKEFLVFPDKKLRFSPDNSANYQA